MNVAPHRYSPWTSPRPVRGVPARLALLASATLVAGLAPSACTFSPPGLSPQPGQQPDSGPTIDGAPPLIDAADPLDASLDAAPEPPPDAGPPEPSDVVHVPEEGWFGGDTAVWNADVTIDTTALTITGPGVAGGTDGIEFDMRPHDPPGIELAVLHIGHWTVGSSATVRVVGDRPLVVISSGNIQLEGRIDAGARGQDPGAGASTAEARGAGESGEHDGSAQDGGGGGGGHATPGARGSIGCPESFGFPDCNDGDAANGGPGGEEYGDEQVTTLRGGAAGGAGGSGASGVSDPCPAGQGGAGGGAVQVYASGTITIAGSGGILAGGGGGQGGQGGNCAASAGGGGGAGGAIYVQAARIDLAGTLAANGGGGGAGAEAGANGENGSDGALNASRAPGGDSDGGASSNGGDGGAGTTGPSQGQDLDENGGGGGGAVGYIVLDCDQFTGGGTISPPPHRIGCAP